jgi:hypothetical protein
VQMAYLTYEFYKTRSCVQWLRRRRSTALSSHLLPELDWPLMGLDFRYENVQRIAGKVADVPTLRAAHELGLKFTGAVLSAQLQLQRCLNCNGCMKIRAARSMKTSAAMLLTVVA